MITLFPLALYMTIMFPIICMQHFYDPTFVYCICNVILARVCWNVCDVFMCLCLEGGCLCVRVCVTCVHVCCHAARVSPHVSAYCTCTCTCAFTCLSCHPAPQVGTSCPSCVARATTSGHRCSSGWPRMWPPAWSTWPATSAYTGENQEGEGQWPPCNGWCPGRRPLRSPRPPTVSLCPPKTKKMHDW